MTDPTDNNSLFRIDVTTRGVRRVVVNNSADRTQALNVLSGVVEDIDQRVASGYGSRDERKQK